MEEKKEKIYISIPDFWNRYELNLNLIDLMQEHPEWFNENMVIESCYGSFPCIWNGGRVVTGNTSYLNIKSTIEPFNERGVSIRHTFTNNTIQDFQYLDSLGNLICILSEESGEKHNIKNGINVSNLQFKNYLEDTYLNLYFLLSTTLGIDSLNEINENSINNIIVPSYTINNNFNILNKLEHPENVEILMGDACIDNCPNRKQHYKLISEAQNYMDSKPFICPNGCESKFYFYDKIPVRKHFIAVEDIYDKYLPIGLNHFKISGRSDHIVNVIERYVYYLVKPEYRDMVRNILLINNYR